jgi:glycosyltransferase involved in cell wall biosynthesis/SAM-dependent methyltransferase
MKRATDVYDASYYEAYGPRDEAGQLLSPPYRRGEPHWKQFFGTIAERIIEQLSPQTVLDAGCAIGFLVEELRSRGVDARGVDVSEWAIAQAPPSLHEFCRVGSLTEEFDRHYDLIICMEVLEHLPGNEAEAIIANICRHCATVLFSSTPDDFKEPTHLNVQPTDYWIGLFAAQGFFRNLHHDASYVAPHAVLLQRQPWTVVEVAEAYERGWWQADRSAQGARASRDLLAQELDIIRGRLNLTTTQLEGIAGDHDRLTAIDADRDRLESAIALERANFASTMRQVGQEAEDAKRELEALKQTRLFRHTSELRRIYGFIRHLQHRPRPSPHQSEGPPHASSYAEWIEQFDTLTEDAISELSSLVRELVDAPLISVVLPVFDPSEQHLREAIESVIDQIYPYWELCIADDASTADWLPRVLTEYEAADPRIRVIRRPTNGHISAATNSALTLANGRFVGFLDHDDKLARQALALVALAISDSPDLGLLYSDEDKIDLEGTRSTPYFKPDWDPFLLLGQNYLTHFCVVRRDLVEAVGGLREGYEGAQDWDLAFRITERLQSHQVGHIPHVLYHWRLHPASTASNQAAKPYAAIAARRATKEHFVRTGRAGRVEPLGRIGYQRVRWTLPEEVPLVSIIIPTRDGPWLQRCLESLWYRTEYPRYEVILVDNGSRDPVTLRYLADRVDKLRVIRDDRPFNFSALNNTAVEHARGDVLCLLNDDVEVINEEWLDEMVAVLLQPEVGIVGAKLYYPDGRIQHAGVVLGIGGIAAHAFRYFDRLFFGHFGHAVLTRQCTAVTAACMGTRREVWEAVGGLDADHLAVSYNDVDYCLRARAQGWRTVWTPSVELIHHESVSRGPDSDAANVVRAKREYDFMIDKWNELIQSDPAYNPNLTLNTEDYALSWPPRIGPFESSNVPSSRDVLKLTAGGDHSRTSHPMD